MSFKVFVSSTYVDLKDHRAHVIQALRNVGISVDPMEDWTAHPDEPKQFSQERVDGCDLCILLVAFRRGFVPKGEAFSITQLEYQYALANEIDALVFLLDDRAPWPRHFDEVPTDNGENNISTWREELKERHGVSFFGLESDSVKIEPAIARWIAERPRPELPVEVPTTSTARIGSQDPTKYLHRLRNDTAYIDIRGLRVGRAEAPRFPIDELYIPLKTSGAAPIDREAKGDARELETAHSGRIELHEALQHQRLVIVGDPGAGKTTFVRRIAFLLSRSLLNEDRAAVAGELGLADQPFPALIRIGELTRFIAKADQRNVGPLTNPAPKWLIHYLATASDEAELGLNEEFFHHHLDSGTAIILLDGLDEAPLERDRRLFTRLIESAVNAYDKCRFVVTTRPAAYKDEVVLQGFTQVAIDPLEDSAIETFLFHWCQNLFPEDRDRASRHQNELSEALRSRREIRRIAHNPVMLTALAVLHWNEKRLPEQRADLYESIIGWLSRQREQSRGRLSPERCVGLLQNLALAMHDHPDGRQVDVSRRWAAEAIAPGWREVHSDDRVTVAEQFLRQEEVDSGIVVGRGDHVRFWHLTFQEYLAARALAALPDDKRPQRLLNQSKLYQPEWKEVVPLLAGVLYHQGIEKVDRMLAVVLDRLGDQASLSDQARFAGLLGGAVRDLSPVNYQPTDQRYEQTLQQVLAIFDRDQSLAVDIKVAIQAADVLGQVGDPRFAVDNKKERWVTIPEGEFLMGAQNSDPEKPNYDSDAYFDDSESPVHRVQLASFQIGRYPVTVAEYERFVEDGGYGDELLWQAGGFGDLERPDQWEQQLEYPNRPVGNVSWYESSAYAAWAKCRLPTEAEWERAARGTDGRRYPWGNEEPESTLLNCYEWKIGHPSPVGIYPRGASPEGVLDMAGNVLEWCQDRYGPYTAEKVDNPRGPENGNRRLLRGGGWNVIAWHCRSANRSVNAPTNRNTNTGFRVVLCVGGQDS